MAKRKDKCATKFCRGKRTKCHTHCPKCRIKIWRHKYPAKAAYYKKKWNAKVKGHKFDITFEYFCQYWIPGYALDRKDALKGYIVGNLQALTIRDNAIKGATVDKKRHAQRYDGVPF